MNSELGIAGKFSVRIYAQSAKAVHIKFNQKRQRSFSQPFVLQEQSVDRVSDRYKFPWRTECKPLQQT